MYEGKIIFPQVMDYLPRKLFRLCVAKYKGDAHSKGFSCRDQYLAMAFAQLTLRDGLRGIQETLNTNEHCLYHMGFRCGAIARNTLAHANEVRPWKMYAEFAMGLMKKARTLYQNDSFAVDLDADVFAVDSTTIELCLKRFPWAKHYGSVAGIKMHVALGLHGNIPDFIVISAAKANDLVIFDSMMLNAGAYYILDRGYFSFKHLYLINMQKAFFVIRPLSNVAFTVTSQNPVVSGTGVISDQSVALTGERGTKFYPELVRRIEYEDQDSGKRFVFFTNDFSLPALTIAELYKQRWQVELFFKWIKQHLQIKQFYGYSDNAVRTQLWIAVSVYCLLALIKKDLKADRELHEIQEILSASIFQKMPILRAFSKIPKKKEIEPTCNQLKLF